MLRVLILGLSFSINVIKLDQLAMQRGKDLVQVSPSYRRKQKESEKVEVSTFDILVLKLKFQHLIIWCALVQYASACSDNIPDLEPLANICR